MRAPSVGRLVVLGITAVFTWSFAAGGSGSTASRRAPWLLFTSTRTGIGQLYVLDPARPFLRQLTFDTTGYADSLNWARAAPDGSEIAVTIGMSSALLGPGGRHLRDWGIPWSTTQPWSPDSKRVLLSSPCSEVVVRPVDGSRDTTLAGVNRSPVWSPDGRLIAMLHADSCESDAPAALAVVSAGGGRLRGLSPRDASGVPAWSPDGQLVAVVRGTSGSGSLYVVPARGGAPTRLSPAGVTSSPLYSPAGDWIAYIRRGRVEIASPDGRRRRVLASVGEDTVVHWSPDGRRLAIGDVRGLRLYDTSTRRWRTLDRAATGDLAWSPDGSRLAYSVTAIHALRLVSATGGSLRTIASLGTTSVIGSLQWAAPPIGAGAGSPEPVQLLTRLVGGEVQLRRPVAELVADGDHVAYLDCRNVVGTWKPGTAPVELLPEWTRPPFTPYACFDPAWLSMGTSGIAALDGAIGYWRHAGGNIRSWSLQVTGRPTTQPLAPWSVTTGDHPLAGWAVGGGDLLVFATRELQHLTWPDYTVLRETIWRVREPGYAGMCPSLATPGASVWGTTPGPCQQLATEPGPFVPDDVDGGRIVASGDNAVVLLSQNGARLLTVPVRASAAALWGSDLVVLVPGELRDYDATTGQLLHAWPVLSVPSGAPCDAATYDCPDVRLRLFDTARGLAAYVLDGQVHVLRLADGSDRVVAAGTAARFVDSGLVYATTGDPPWVGRIRFVPDASLG